MTRHVAFDNSGEPDETVERMLALRGHGTTDLRGGLDAALAVADAAPAGRHLTILLSDCRATDLAGVESAAAAVPELAILAPSADHDAAMGLARAVDARLFLLEGPRDVVSALDGAFSRR